MEEADRECKPLCAAGVRSRESGGGMSAFSGFIDPWVHGIIEFQSLQIVMNESMIQGVNG
jgi:hypothetical protein